MAFGFACGFSKPKLPGRPLQFQPFSPPPVFSFPFSIRLHPDGVELSAAEIRQAVQAALAEDIGEGDATTLATVPEAAMARAVMCAREPLIVTGLDLPSRFPRSL